MKLLRPAKISVIESEPGSLVLLTNLLHLFSSEIELSPTVYHSDIAEELIINHPDLVLIDSKIDDKLSQQICMGVRASESDRHVGIVFVGADENGSSKSLVEFLELGADDFIRSNCSEREFLARINAIIRLKMMTDDLRRANHKLKVLSLTDELTGLANMRAFNQHFLVALKKCREGEDSISVIMMDLDRFKSVNDSYNHLVGSSVIAQTGRIIQRILGTFGENMTSYVAARYGGDEFVIFLSGLAEEQTRDLAENIRLEIQEYHFPELNPDHKITTSIGVLWTPPLYQGSGDRLLKLADQNLYRSKKKGRNRVTFDCLGDLVNFEHVSGTHGTDGNPSGDDDKIA